MYVAKAVREEEVKRCGGKEKKDGSARCPGELIKVASIVHRKDDRSANKGDKAEKVRNLCHMKDCLVGRTIAKDNSCNTKKVNYIMKIYFINEKTITLV